MNTKTFITTKKYRLAALLTVFALFLSGCSALSRIQGAFGLQSESDKFELYLQELFTDRVTSSLLDYHYSIYDADNFDFPLEKPETAWGEFEIDDYINYEDEVQEQLDKLTAFNYEKLTEEQQFIYDINLYYYENELSCAPYYLYATNFNTSGIHSQIPVLLAEYTFYSTEDIEDYLKLLEESYDYMEALLSYETYRAGKGLRLSDYTIETVIENCEEFIDSNPNVLAVVFEEKLEAFPELTEKERADYIAENEAALENSLLPAYELIISTLEETRTLCEEPEALGATEEGQKYFEYLVRYYTGSSQTVPKMNKQSQKAMNDYLMTAVELYQTNPDVFEEHYDYVAPDITPEEMLISLLERLTEDFPELQTPSYEVKYVSEALEEMLNPAFYMVPPVDSIDKNTIYINGSPRFENYDLFTVMAHEGFPGHLYQKNFFHSTNPHYIRNTLSFLGYTEGWATYVENYYGYEYSDRSTDCAVMACADNMLGLSLSTIIDFGVNYYGWSIEDTADFLSSLGYPAEAAEELYNLVFDDPGVYSSYFIGCLEILELRGNAEKKLKEDFDTKKFHQFLLETGPAPFTLIEDKMAVWIKEQ